MYSPISKIYIKNFRNIGEVELSFKESPIICLIGENEAGKTSVIKAFATCALHANPRDQKDYIRDGTQMFGVAIELEDGSKILRLKTNTLNKYQVTRADGTTWETTKISEGLPVEVQKLMGLIEEPETKEFLHIRTYEDKLLFVVTPASVNYKVMYNALKVEQLTKAIKAGSVEANSLKTEINNNQIKMSTLVSQINAFNVVDIEPLIDIRDRLNKQKSVMAKLEKALNVKRAIDKCNGDLGVLRLLERFNLKEINMSKALTLNAISRTYNRIEDSNNERAKISEAASIETVDLSTIQKVDNIRNRIEELAIKKRNAGEIIKVRDLQEINQSSLVQLESAIHKLNDLNYNKKMLSAINTDACSTVNIDVINKLDRALAFKKRNTEIEPSVKQLKEYVDGVLNYMKQIGVAFEQCPNCGTDVMIDLDKIS